MDASNIVESSTKAWNQLTREERQQVWRHTEQLLRAAHDELVRSYRGPKVARDSQGSAHVDQLLSSVNIYLDSNENGDAWDVLAFIARGNQTSKKFWEYLAQAAVLMRSTTWQHAAEEQIKMMN